MLMAAIVVVTLYPFWYTVIGSFNQGLDFARGGVHLWPRAFTLENYRIVFRDNTIMRAYGVTIVRTALGATSRLLVCGLFAYAFSRPRLSFRGFYATVGIISMYFHGGIIPSYINIRDLGLLNNFFVYIFPTMFNFFHVLIITAYMRGISHSVVESAKIDGASDYRVFFQIILPLSMPVFAAVGLFAAVEHWNAFFDAMMYVSRRELYTLQVLLMEIIRTQQAAAIMAAEMMADLPEDATSTGTTVQLATMVAAIGPVIALYPFLQKYFVTGIMIGSVIG